VIRIPRSDRTLVKLRMYLEAVSPRALSVAGAFILGFVVNLSTDGSVTSLRGLAAKLLSVRSNPLLVLPWIALVVLVVFPLVRVGLRRYLRGRGHRDALAGMVQPRVDPSIAPYAGSTIAWGTSLPLALPPSLSDGWRASEVVVRYHGRAFTLPRDIQHAFDGFKRGHVSTGRFRDDGVKLMLLQNPASFSDAPTLQLTLGQTRYSEVQFYRENVAAAHGTRDPLIRRAIEGPLQFPHSLCLHGVVISDDRKVLVTQRSSRVAYFPHAWSVSLEEQMMPDDLKPSATGAIQRLALRLLCEELGIEQGEVDGDRIRILSVFLEADILNCSMVGLLPIRLSSEAVDSVLRTRVRNDYEFCAHRWLTITQLRSELVEPSMSMHPTSGLRMLLTLASVSGEPDVAELLRPDAA
jgi:isopentenyldiphosphate isomerase